MRYVVSRPRQCSERPTQPPLQDEGPLELTRRKKVLVWDDEIPMTEDMLPDITPTDAEPEADAYAEPAHAHAHPAYHAHAHAPHISPHASIASMPPLPTQPRRTRSQSISGFPPPIRRTSTDMAGLARPVSFSAKFQRVHPATTGVTVLEHMERLDAVEAGLKRIGVEDGADADASGGEDGSGGEGEGDGEEVDVGESTSSSSAPARMPASAPPTQTSFASPPISRESSAGEGAPPANMLSPAALSDRLPAVPEADDADANGDANGDGDGYATDGLSMSFAEEDLVALSKSTSQIEAPHSALHTRFASYRSPPIREEEQLGLEWMRAEAAESPRARTVVVEVRGSCFCCVWTGL